MTTEGRPRRPGRPRRRHAAAGARIVAAGASVSAALVMAAAMANAAGRVAPSPPDRGSASIVVSGPADDPTFRAGERASAPPLTRSSAPPVATSTAS